MRRAVMLGLALLSLSGCAAAGPAITGLATAGVAGTVGSATGSALAGVVAGIGVSYGVDQGVKYAERRVEDNVQDSIASTAGPLPVGGSAHWQSQAELPLSGKSGTLEIARAFGTAIPCKDVVFTVADEEPHDVYTTTICRNDEGEWRWALAEPATRRWGYLQ